MDWRKIKNDLMLATGSQVLQKLVGYVVLMLLVRHLDKALMGQFFLAGTLATLLALATELGVNKHLTRRVAQQPDLAMDALGQVLALRLPLMLAGYALMALAVYLIKPELTVPVVLTNLYVLIQDYYYTFASVMLALRRVGMRVASMLIGQVLTAALVVGAVQMQAGLNMVLACYVIANAVMMVLTIALVRWKFGPFTLTWRYDEARRIVWLSLPFFLLTVLGVIHFKVDSLMLGMLRNYEEVATYEAAYKFLEVSRFIVRPAAMIFFPLCCELAARGDWTAYEHVLRKLLVTVGGLGAAASAAVMVGAGWVVTLVFGETYSDSSPVLRILFLSVPSVYLGFVASFLANSLHLEKRALYATTVCLAANIALNAVAIPRYGAPGAAWATLATETVLAAWLLSLIAARLSALKRQPVLAGFPSITPDAAAILEGGEEIVNHDATL